MKKIIITIVFFASLLPKIHTQVYAQVHTHAQDKTISLNYNIFFDGRFSTNVINGNFLVHDTVSNISFALPFEYWGGDLKIKSEDYEKLNLLKRPIISMDFDMDVMLDDGNTILHNYHIKIPHEIFNYPFVNIKIYNKESKRYRKYWRQDEEYIVDIRACDIGTITPRYWKSKRRIEQFRKEEVDGSIW